MLPVGLFMLLMSLRSKNSKATAIGTFTNVNSEFQHIFPNFILVIVEPSWLKQGMSKRLNKVNEFVKKYTSVFFLTGIVILIGIFLVLSAYFYFNISL